MNRKSLFLATLVCIAVGGLVYHLVTPKFIPPVLPVPNGYDDLLRAAEMLAPRTGFFDEMEPEELAAIVAQNQAALALALEALNMECAVPLDWSPDAKWMDQAYLDQASTMRTIARAFAAQAKHAAEQGDSDLVLRSGINNLRLGRATANGGLHRDWLLGQAIGSKGVQILRDQTDQFSKNQCQKVQEALQAYEPYLEASGQVLQRERAFYRHTNGLNGALEQMLLRSQLNQAEKQANETEKRHDFTRTLLRTHLAVRQFQLAEERLPETLGELVPKYLSRVPVEPDSRAELVYEKDDGNYLIYSFAAEGEEAAR